jgi:hypothetical protein
VIRTRDILAFQKPAFKWGLCGLEQRFSSFPFIESLPRRNR